MADRTVKVRLELDDDAFKGGLKGDAAAVRDFDGEVRTLGDHAARTGVEMKAAGNDIQATGEEIKAVGRAAVPTTDQVRKLGDEATSTGDKAVSAGSRLETLATALHNVDEEIARSKTLLGELADEFGRTGNTDLVQKFSSENSNLSGLTRFKAELEKMKQEADKEAANIGQSFWSKVLNLGGSTVPNALIPSLAAAGSEGATAFGGSFLSSLGAVFSAAAPVLAPAVVLLVSELGAMASGALIGGAGFVGIAAGIAAQFNDARVKGAVSNFVAWAKSELDQATSGFAPRLAEGFAALQRNAQPFFDAIRQPLQDLSPLVANLLARLGEGLAKLGPGLAQALQAAGPILERIGADLPMLLGSIGNMFSLISEHAKGAGEAVDLLFHLASQAMTIIGVSLSGLSSVFNAILQGADAVTGFMAKIPGIGKEWQPVHQYVDNLAHSVDGFGMSAATATGATSGLTGALGGTAAAAAVTAAHVAAAQQAVSGYQSAALAADQANLAAKQSFQALDAAVKQNGRSLNENTSAGLANRQALDATVGALQRQRDAAIAAAGGQNASREAVDAANAKYAQQIGVLIDHAGKVYGDKAAVAALIGQIAAIPNSHMTNIQIVGIAQAEGGLSAIASQLNALPSEKRVSVVTSYYTANGITPGGINAPRVAQRWGGITEHAADGLLREAQTFTAASTGARYAFAEPQTQGEAFIPRSGDLERSRSIWGYVGANWLGMKGAGGHGSVTTINVTVNAGIGTDVYAVGRQLADAIKPYIRSAGGGNVQAALGVRGS